jgi:rare lipoprotein A
MQSTLRVGGLILAGLLFGFSTSAAALKTTKHQAAHPKVRYVGVASWYGKQHQGRKMANGQKFDRNKLTAASWYFPLGTSLLVTNVGNGESVVVTITDRGPNRRLNRIVDLSEAAAKQLDYIGAGLTRVFTYPLMPLSTESAASEPDLHAWLGRSSGDEALQYAAVTLAPGF